MSSTEFEKQQEDLKAQMIIVAEKIQKINKNAGKELIAYIGTISAAAVGIPAKIPARLAYGVLGPIGLFLSLREAQKLKPLYSELEGLTDKYNLNAQLYNDALQKGLIKEVQAVEAARSGNVNVGGFQIPTWALLVFPGVVFYLYKRNRQQ